MARNHSRSNGSYEIAEEGNEYNSFPTYSFQVSAHQLAPEAGFVIEWSPGIFIARGLLFADTHFIVHSLEKVSRRSNPGQPCFALQHNRGDFPLPCAQ